MSFFDDDDFFTTADPRKGPSAAGLKDFEDEEDDDEMMDVDLRLDLADHYRAITKNKFFSQNTEAAQIVNDEIRAFIRERLEVLLGLRAEKTEESPAPVQSQFTDEEASALKALAAKVLGRPQIVDPPKVVPRTEVQVTAPVRVVPSSRATQPEPPSQVQRKTRKAKTGPKAKEKRVREDGKVEVLVEGTVTRRGNRNYTVVKNERTGELYEKDSGPVVTPPKKTLTVAELNASNAALGPDYGNGGGGSQMAALLANKLVGN